MPTPHNTIGQWEVPTLRKYMDEVITGRGQMFYNQLSGEEIIAVSSLRVLDKVTFEKYGKLTSIGGSAAPAFANAWTNFGGSTRAAGFYKDAFGIVHLRGVIKSGTINTAAFTLPPGYKPEGDVIVACSSNGAFGSCTISSSGTVTPAVGSNVSFSLDNIRFKAA